MLSTYREACGIATYSEQLVAALERLGLGVQVIAPRLEGADPPGPDAPARLWSRGRAGVGQALRVFAAVRSARADVVHAQVHLGLFPARFLATLAGLCRAAGLPLVATLHARGGGALLRRLDHARVLLALRGAALVVHGESHRRELRRAGVRVIPHGVAPIVPRSIAEARGELGLPLDVPIVGHFGFLHPDKGLDEVLRALARLRAAGFPRLVYLVCGAPSPWAAARAYAERLRALARELGVELHMSGEFVSGARALLTMQAADLLVLNYRTGSHQGASGAARSALSSGRPLAVSSAAIFDDIRAAVHTLTAPLDRHLGALLADETLRRRPLADARRLCAEESWEWAAADHRALYQELLARHGSRA
jgi:glycosyltransferase involved in cell wall biosynthesis